MRLARALLLSLLLLPILATAELPNKTSGGFSEIAWREKGQELILKLFPGDIELINSIQITIVKSVQPAAYVPTGDKEICVSYGLIFLIIDTEDEYAAVLAHEFAHIKLRHISTKIYKFRKGFSPEESEPFNGVPKKNEYRSWFGEVYLPPPPELELVENFELLEKQETEADDLQFSVISKTNFCPCALADILRKLDRFDETETATDPYSVIEQKRIARIESNCRPK